MTTDNLNGSSYPQPHEDFPPTIDMRKAMDTFAVLLTVIHTWAQSEWRDLSTANPSDPDDQISLDEKLALGSSHWCGTTYCFAGLHAQLSDEVEFIAPEPTTSLLHYANIVVVKEPAESVHPLSTYTPWEGLFGLRTHTGAKITKDTLMDRVETWARQDLGLRPESETFSSSNSLEELLINLLAECAGIEIWNVESELTMDDLLQDKNFSAAVLVWVPGLIEVMDWAIEHYKVTPGSNQIASESMDLLDEHIGIFNDMVNSATWQLQGENVYSCVQYAPPLMIMAKQRSQESSTH